MPGGHIGRAPAATEPTPACVRRRPSVTAPMWMASPPEVHSTLLSSGPGAGPLLASAGAWTALGAEYTEVAGELTAALGQVQAGVWDGPTAATYAGAHAPYLTWLSRAGADAAAMAAQHETAATAYTSALAAMPTLAELAANHATHATLVATNFFGINAIPIAVNEADYARMWAQAATVMGAYETVSDTAVAAAPPTEPAPTVLKMSAGDGAEPTHPQTPAWFHDLTQYLHSLIPQPPYPKISDYPMYQEILHFFDKIGYTGIGNPFSDFFAALNGSLVVPPPGVPGSWLAFTGNPFSFFNPGSLAYIFSVPLDLGSYIAFTTKVIVDDMIAILWTALFNPQYIGIVTMLATVEMATSVLGNTVQLLNYLLEPAIALIPAATSLLAAPATLAPLAITPVAALGGLAGLAGLAGIPPPAMPVPPALAAPTPAPTSAPSSAPPTPPSAPPAPPDIPPPSGTPPVLTPGASSFGLMGMENAMGMGDFGYLVGGLSSAARRRARAAARAQEAPESDTAETPEAAEPAENQATVGRRPVKVQWLGRGYEYMDLEPDPEPGGDDPARPVASDQGGGQLGFSGTVGEPDAGRPAGLARAGGNRADGSATTPMMPTTWR